MPRARLALGSHGVISVTGQRQVNGRWASVSDGTKADRYRATTRYRDRDGNTRTVERFAKTKGLARAKINHAIANFENEEELRANASTRKTLAASAKVWLELVERDATLADKSKAHYRGTWERCIKGTDLAAMPLVQVNVVSTLRAFLQRVADERGTASARSVRSVLSGILGLATEDGVLPMNACRSLRPVRAKNERETTRDIRRALTADERNRLLAVAEAHPRAISQDVTDVIAFMAATGVRVGEALGLQWKDVNRREGTVHVRGTKSRSSDRVLAMPASLTDRLRQRADVTGRFGYVFPSPQQRDQLKPRDQRNVARVMREVFDAAGLTWATPHSLRRTAATLILEAGYSPTVAQAQLGHADAGMTLRAYAAKRAEPSQAAADLLELTTVRAQNLE